MAENRIVPFNETNLAVITDKRNHLLSLATALTISDAKSYEFACELAKGISGLRTSIVDEFAEEKDRRYKAHRAVCDLEKRYLDGVVEPDKIVRGKISSWNEEQDKLQREQERLAREKAEEEAEERRLQEAIKAEAQGRPDVAQKILDAPAAPVAITLPRTETPKVSGLAMVTNWYFKVEDPKLVPDEYKTIDESKIRKVVQALKENATIPGVRVFSRKEPRIGGRKQPTSEPTAVPAPVTAQASGEDLWG
jgi:hypothetical protein